MAKRLKLADQGCAAPAQATDWNICALCQKHGGKLLNPSPQGYATLATNLASFQELNKVPQNINIARLNDGGGIEETLSSHKAKWHKSCYVLYNATKVERARKSQNKLGSKEVTLSLVKQRLRSSFASTSIESADIDDRQPPACFFCDKTHGDLHKATTMSLDARVRQIATDMRDTKLLLKLSAGDMVALDAMYHKDCLSFFYNRHRSVTQSSKSKEKRCQLSADSLAFAEVVSYIEEHERISTDTSHMFKLTDLKQLYCEHLQAFGGENAEQYIHSTRLAQKLQQFLPNLEVHHSKAGTVLTFKKDIGDALLDACYSDQDEEAVMLMRVAKLIRKDIFEMKYRFDGSLADAQYDDLPTSLFALVRMILGGINAEKLDEVKLNCFTFRIIKTANTKKLI